MHAGEEEPWSPAREGSERHSLGFADLRCSSSSASCEASRVSCVPRLVMREAVLALAGRLRLDNTPALSCQVIADRLGC